MIASLLKGSWKTTGAGWLAIVGSAVRFYLALKSGHVDAEATTTTLTSLAVGLGLLAARDNDKSTEQVQTAKPKPTTPPTSLWLLAALLFALLVTIALPGCVNVTAKTDATYENRVQEKQP